jgi:hypothetical protein
VGIKRRARSGGARRLSGLVIGIALRSRDEDLCYLDNFKIPVLEWCPFWKFKGGDLISIFGDIAAPQLLGAEERGQRNTKRDA